jgi:hypothetical protein
MPITHPVFENATVYPKHLAHPSPALNKHTTGVMGVKG